MPDSHKLQADDRDPDQIIRDLRDRIEELEPSLRDWKDMAMKYRAALDRAEKAFDAIGHGIFPGSEYRNGHEPYAKSLAVELRTVLHP